MEKQLPIVYAKDPRNMPVEHSCKSSMKLHSTLGDESNFFQRIRTISESVKSIRRVWKHSGKGMIRQANIKWSDGNGLKLHQMRDTRVGNNLLIKSSKNSKYQRSEQIKERNFLIMDWLPRVCTLISIGKELERIMTERDEIYLKLRIMVSNMRRWTERSLFLHHFILVAPSQIGFALSSLWMAIINEYGLN